MSRYVRFGATLLGGAALAVGALVVPSAQARPSDTTTISMFALSSYKPAWDVLIPNFERVYPNIKVDVTYGDPAPLAQLETVELAADNAPDVLYTGAGCGTTISICILAKAGYLAPIVKAPWVKWSMPLVTSANKYGQGLFGFTPTLAFYGIWTNDDLFRKLGLKVPQTFAQLLDVCQKAKAAGTTPLMFAAAPSAGTAVRALVLAQAIATLLAKDTGWPRRLRAGTATFAATPGWHEALQHVADLNSAGCFQPGAVGTSIGSAITQFAQGQSLMMSLVTAQKGLIDAGNPQFRYSHHPFPDGTDPNQTRTFLQMSTSMSVNAHTSPQAQHAAQTLIDFVARPKQNALYAETTGGITQYQFLHRQIPAFMADYSPVIEQHRYVIAPFQTGWWTAAVDLALEQAPAGLLTGQRTVDDVLNALDAAWKQGR